MREEILVILPYAPRAASGQELETAVRGWIRHFRGHPRIIIIGERCSVVDNLVDRGLVEHIARPASKDPDGPEREFAALAQFVVDTFGKDYPGFIKTDDDIYPVSDFTIADVKRLKWIGSELKGNPYSGNHFQRAMYNTQVALRENGLPIINYCSHAPRWYNCEELGIVLERFVCKTTPHLIEPLYFNYWNEPDLPKVNVNAQGNPLKYGIYSPLNPAGLEAALQSGVKWVNNSAPYYDKRIIDLINNHSNN